MKKDAPETSPKEGRIRNMAELARIAGVNPGTVSKALADSPLVALETRQRIQDLAAKHNYRPNQMARRLRTRRTGVIGIVVPLGHEQRQHLSDPFFMSLLGYLADTLTENGYDIMLSRVIPNAEDWLERIVESGMLDGVLIIGQSDQHDVIERVARTYRPLVAWGCHRAEQVHCAIGSDNFEGGRLAGARLIAAGSRQIAFIGETRAPEFRLRFGGVAAAMAEAGLTNGPRQLPVHIASDEMEQEIAAQMDGFGEGIDGIVAASDVIAMQTLRVLADRSIDVPGRIRVIGYDDIPLAMHTVPRLTTIKQDLARGAEAMVSALFARIAGQDTASLQMAPTLVERDTA